jgi:glyoxylase-like metal-dependent hydrolase (beta-lactamase superfamily II)
LSALRRKSPMKRRCLLLLACLCLACADVASIENGQVSGPVVTLKDWFTSCQLLKTRDGAVLFDACFRKGALEDGLATHGLVPADVTHVLLTHAHGDHVGGLGLLKDARVLALAKEQTNLGEHAEGRQIDQIITDGEVLTFGEYEVLVFSVPGHTPGSAAFFVDGALVLGDNALLTGDGTLEPVPAKRSEDPAQAVTSLLALVNRLVAEELEVRWLVPAHSGSIEGRQALIEFAASQR